jgi:hypothetical protein
LLGKGQITDLVSRKSRSALQLPNAPFYLIASYLGNASRLENVDYLTFLGGVYICGFQALWSSKLRSSCKSVEKRKKHLLIN